MDSRRCSVQKCTLWQRGTEPSCRGPESLLRTSARPWSPTWTSPQLTTSAFLEPSSLCHADLLCKCHTKTKPVHRSARTSTSLSRTRSLFSAFSFTATHPVGATEKGATTTLPIHSPSHTCSRRRDCRNKLRKASRTKHENKESVPRKLSLLILNLEEWVFTLLGPRSLRTKVLPAALDLS